MPKQLLDYLVYKKKEKIWIAPGGKEIPTKAEACEIALRIKDLSERNAWLCGTGVCIQVAVN